MRKVADDPFCLPDGAAAIRATLPEVAPVAEAPAETPAETPETPTPPGPAEPTRFLSDARVQEVLADQLAPMRDCVIRHRVGPSLPARVRVVMVIFADGHTERTTISPPNPEAEQCIAEIVATVQFPRILEERQQVTFWLAIRAPGIGGVPAGTPPPAPSGATPATPPPAPPPATPPAPASRGAGAPSSPH